MKKRNKLRIPFLLMLVLLLSIGYAALTTTLKINGTSAVKGQTWNIYWDNIQVTSGSVTPDTENGEKGATIKTGLTEVEYAVTLTEPGEFYEFTVDAVNNGTIDAMIAANGIKNEVYEADGTTKVLTLPDYVRYTVKYANGDEIEDYNLLAKKNGNTATRKTYKVRVEYRQDINPSDINNVNTDTVLNFKFSVEYVQATSSNSGDDASSNDDGITITNPSNGVKDGDTQYLSSSWVNTNAVYYDPTIPAECTLEQYNSNTQKTQNKGCLKWYVYAVNGNKAYLIMDNDLYLGASNKITWQDYVAKPSGITVTALPQGNSMTNYHGPELVLYNLGQYTSDWKTSMADEPLYVCDLHSINAYRGSYTIDYTSYHAKIISADEVAKIAGNTTWSLSNQSFIRDLPSFLTSNLTDETGFWTSTAEDDPDNGKAWYVWKRTDYQLAQLQDDWIEAGSDDVYQHAGVRPVIKVPVTILD